MGVWDKKRNIMHRYDLTARIYDMRYAEEQTVKIEAALKHMKVKGCMALDAGCGTGILFSYVADKARMTVGLDVSKKTLLKAKERARDYANVHLVCADVDNMPVEDGVFDKVFAMTLIQNTPNPAETLKQIRRVSADNALIVVTGLKKIFARSVFQQLLKNAGLNNVAIEDEGLKCYVAVCIKAQHA
jgi:ubiquinone/menaquinone biosynthesis C-methylase UbiE